MTSGDIVMPTILGLCNPLLDITAHVDNELLDKYKLKPNDAIMASGLHQNLFRDLVDKYSVEYSAGGSAMNVMRVVAGIYRSQQVQGKSLFTGCIGDDEFGQVMKKKASSDGVEANFSISKEEATGTCAVCLTNGGKNRSLCAFLGASQKFSHEHLESNWDELVAKTNVIYISGFLIAVSPRSYHLLGEHVTNTLDKSKRFCLNLSATYVSEVFGHEIEKVIKYVDVLFGNDEEVRAFAKFKKYSVTDIPEIAKKLVLEDKLRKSVERMVVVTHGEGIVLVATGKHDDDAVKIETFSVPQIPDNEIVDTNGAGDAFAAGFISQLALNQSLKSCVDIGILAAQEIIKVSGINFPNEVQVPKPTK